MEAHVVLAFKKYIEAQHWFNTEDKILLAVSGGIDSVVMVHLFALAGYKFGIAHCNFCLRGKDSDDDEQFVRSLAKDFQVNFHSIYFDTEKYAQIHRLSIQMAARELRYRWFEEIREQFGYKFTAIAHHQNDSIETVFINLIRGTGLAGLHGISEKRDAVIRPLSCLNRLEIETIAKENGIDYREDASNASVKYIRNKIRHQIIPLLSEINPNFGENILKSISNLRDSESLLQDLLKEKRAELLKNEGDAVYISISELLEYSNPLSLLYHLLKPYGFSLAVLKDALQSEESGRRFLAAEYELLRDRHRFILLPLKNVQEENAGYEHLFTVSVLSANDAVFGNDPNVALFDFDKLKLPLIFRRWQTGDKMVPLGMKGSKKISDMLINHKTPLYKKEETLVVLSGAEIIWLVGIRISERFKITKQTRRIYRIQLRSKEDRLENTTF